MIQRYKNLPIRAKLTSIFVLMLLLVGSFIYGYFPRE